MSLPDMSDAIDDLGDPCSVAVIAKSADQFRTKETISEFRHVYGVKVPTQPRELKLLPEGLRNWKTITLYSQDTTLENDYYVQDEDGVQYRIVGHEPWQGAQFMKYFLQETTDAGSAIFQESFAAEGGS
jgi:hypothetical protein